ncbi:MAG: hypothetical protein ACQEVA_11770, partial [Myxococcota bacterium]
MSLFRNPHRKFLYLVLTLIALGLAAAIVWLRPSMERPVPERPVERQAERVSLRPYVPDEPATPDATQVEPKEPQDPEPKGVACEVDVVWDFVEAAREQAPECSTFPANERLEQLDCHVIEWAVLDSGCVPAATYFASERLHTQKAHYSRADAYCNRLDPIEWQNGYRYVALRDGSLICVGTDESCSAARACRTNGRCTADERGVCRPGSDAHCERSGICQSQGRCSRVDGRCQALTGDCDETDQCKRAGKCTARDGECVVDDAGCAASRMCGYRADCAKVGDRCAPTREAHCDAAKICELNGRCTFADGACIAATNADCESSRHCKERGECVAFQGQCHRGSPSLCEQSLACLEDGKCAFVDGRCVRGTDAECAGSEGCEQHGRCTAVDNRCRATSQSDCDQIANSNHAFRDGKCVREPHDSPVQYTSGDLLPVDFDCAQTQMCQKHGFGCDKEIVASCVGDGPCDRQHATCVTRSNLCEAMPDCAEKGTCKTQSPMMFSQQDDFQRLERCLADTDKSMWWRCFERSNLRCVRSEAGCQNSKLCEDLGHCSTRSRSSLCVATRPEHCLESAACAERGACGMDPTSTYHTCGATKAWHCAQSEACKEDGACFLNGGACETAEVLGIDGSCMDSERCETYGECTLMSRDGECAPTDLAHCEQSDACREDGKCGIVYGRCVATEPDHCEASKGCADGGRCELRHGSCHTPEFAAALDAQCADGRARDVERSCSAHNPNKYPHTAPVESACADRRTCEISGNCATGGYGDICEPSEPAHCAQSRECATQGACGVAYGMAYRGPSPAYCAPTRDSHCDGTIACIEEG